MKTYRTIFIPQINILKTICRDIEEVDRENPFLLGMKKHYNVKPFCFAIGGNIVTALTDNQLEKFNIYQSSITTDTANILNILENDFDIICQETDIIATIITFNGDCDKYIGESMARDKMVEYLDNLKTLCLNTKI